MYITIYGQLRRLYTTIYGHIPETIIDGTEYNGAPLTRYVELLLWLFQLTK